jgi:hypothetical protein
MTAVRALNLSGVPRYMLLILTAVRALYKSAVPRYMLLILTAVRALYESAVPHYKLFILTAVLLQFLLLFAINFKRRTQVMVTSLRLCSQHAVTATILKLGTVGRRC